MEVTERLLSILLIKKSLSADMRIKVEAHAARMIQYLTYDAGVFLHNLDVEQHTEDEVKAAITHFPSALSHLHDYSLDDDDDGQDEYDRNEMLPIQAAARDIGERKSIPFIPLLAEAGEKYNIGGEGQRGGLLAKDAHGDNVLQTLVINQSSDDDSVCLDVFKRLRQSDLLKKEDIRQYDLLRHTCKTSAKDKFEYLVDWDPKAVKELLRGISSWSNIGAFTLMLKAGLKYYPEELGFLFRKSRHGFGKTAWYRALDQFGRGKTLSAVEKCLEETTDAKMLERNPMTNAYPFMLAAAGDTSELSIVYHLLRRDPEVSYRATCSQIKYLDCVERKRKRDLETTASQQKY